MIKCKPRIRIDVIGVVGCVILYLLNGKEMFLYIVFSALAHETGHLIAMFFCGVSPLEISVGFLNLNIKYRKATSPYKKDLIIAFFGPFVNVLICVFSYIYGNTELLFINAYLAFVNLLPFPSLDGKNILDALIGLKGIHDEESSIKRYERILTGKIVSFCAVGLFCLLCGFNLSVVFTSVSFLMCQNI